jgi:biotin/methionine sulfoxide reductase
MTLKNRITASHWGAGLATLQGDQIIAVNPHPADPDPSRINENIPQGIQGRARVLRPAVRKSWLEHGPLAHAGERGAEPFVEVSWDRALDLLAGELARVKADHGNQAIYAGSYGWASAGRFHHAQGQLKRFLNSIGGFVRSEGNYSYNAALVLMPHIVGNYREHIKDVTRWTNIAAHGRLVVMFGGVALRNAQVGGGGVARHRLRGDMAAAAKAGVRFVNLSPLRGDVDAELKAEWLPPRPGSDTAVMMGLAHTLLVEGLHDRAFLDRYTVGFDRFAAYLLGKTDGVAKSADWAADLSGLPADRLRSLAREMAATRTMISMAVGLQRADHGEQPIWMTVTLAAMLGQIGLPGGGFAIGYGADAAIGTMDKGLEWPSLPQGINPVADYIPVAMVSDMLLHPGAAYDYNGETRNFPDIRMVWWAGGNPFHHHQDLNRLRSAFQRPQTVVVSEINWTATARHADIVLPVAAPQERSDFAAGTQDNALIPMPALVPPMGEARCEYDIYAALEQRLGNDQKFSRGMTAKDWQEDLWAKIRNRAGRELPDWEAFLQGELIEFPDPAPDAVYLTDFRADPLGNPLKTPSGKIEIFSQTIAGFNYDDCPGHPTWLAPREWLGAKGEPLHLISGQPETRLHSQLDLGAFSQSRKVQGREPVLINTIDANARGIKDGDVVTLHNARGACLAGAVVTKDVRPGVVFLWTGAWYDPDLGADQHRDRHGNPNVLTHDLRTSRLSQGPAAQSALVEVTRFEGELPEVQAYDPPLAK